jgi:hypothetical protein
LLEALAHFRSRGLDQVRSQRKRLLQALQVLTAH